MTVYVVISPGPVILGAYTNSAPAHIHMRCVTGASVMAVELLETLPDSVRDELNEEFVDDDPTPVVDPQAALKREP